ncbi:unnamed protein product [Musa acuminata subsp. malaccensis]|uniref:(wild Malaysian banana) hypothetical protein n=1 Tax=Musa acuminata subsp. malaccensis TaxID=214687 RepID=A0A8D7AFQ5_MUSAM|nr:unnamed protein product [Musa acuminata subsp. malaccensis]
MYGSAPKENVHQSTHYRTEDYDEYEEEYDEYEEEASERDGEDEQEAPKPTKEEQEFLSVREQLKDRIRTKLKKQNARALGHSSQTQDKRRTTTNATFGSFFGPSQPVIASRVIEESRSIRETRHVMTNLSSSVAFLQKKRDATASASTLLTQQHHKKPAVVNEIKNKAQTLKDMRDYSFLLSDDTDFPTAKEQPATRSVSAPKSDGRYAQTSLKSQLPMNQPVKLVSVANGLRNPDSRKQNIQSNTGFAKEAPLNRPLPASTDSQKVLSGAVGNGSSKPMGTNPSQRIVGNGSSKPMGTNPSQRRVVGNGSSKPMGTNPSQRVVGNGSSKPMVTNPSQRFVGNGSSKPMVTNPSQRVVGNGSSRPAVTNPSQRVVGNGSSRPVVTNPSQRVVGNGSSRPVVTNPSQRVVGNGSSRPVVTNPSQRVVGNGSGRPMVTNPSQRVVGNGSSKPMGNSSSQRKVPIQAAGANKPLSKVVNDPYLKKDISAAKPHSSALKHYPEKKRLTQGLDQVKTTVKQSMPPSKSQPIKQSFSHGNLDNRLKRRPSGRNLSDEEDVDYRSLIRGMFGYNPNKYAGMDEDDSDMEVGFDVIQKEERISSKIARKEDEEQLRLIEEEEERERQMRRRMKKKPKH